VKAGRSQGGSSQVFRLGSFPAGCPKAMGLHLARAGCEHKPLGEGRGCCAPHPRLWQHKLRNSDMTSGVCSLY